VNLIHAVLCDDEGVTQARGCLRHETHMGFERLHCTIYCLKFCAALMTQSGNIYRPIIQTATCSLPRYRSKHIAGNSQCISQTTTRSRHYWQKKSTSKTPRGRKYMHSEAARKTHSTNGMNIKSRVTCKHTTQWEHVNSLCPAGWLNEQAITNNSLVPVRTFLSI